MNPGADKGCWTINNLTASGGTLSNVILLFCFTGYLFQEEDESYVILRLRVFENTVARKIFGPKEEEMRIGWIKLQTEEFHNLHPSPIIISILKSWNARWVDCSTYGYIALQFPRNSYVVWQLW
jgi:hypothetical protein